MYRHILITGASSGIGRALAFKYASENTVLTLISRNIAPLRDISDICISKGSSVNIFTADVSSYSDINRIILDADKLLPVDLMILSAGVTSLLEQGSLFEDIKVVDKLIDTNLKGTVFCISSVIPEMCKRRHGHIVIVSSLAAYYGMAYSPAYCASKSALKAYGESLRQYLRNDKITVSVVMPGFVKTPMSDRFRRPKPFMVTTDTAATIIYKGITNKKAYIRFPFLLQISLRLISLFPYRFADFLVRASGYGK